MGFKKNAEIGVGRILTVIGKDNIIRGTVQGAGPLRIDGKIQGEVDVQGDVIIGEGAVLEAAVKGRNIQVGGHVVGNIEAQGKLIIQVTGIVEGDVLVQALQVDDGAVFRGACSMRQAAPKNSKSTV